MKEDALAWLDTIGEETKATIRDRPRETVVPPEITETGQRALAILKQLSAAAMGSSLQLRQGEVIGEGGMGIVRSAEQVALGRTVAVKTLKRKDAGAALDLLREAWVTGAIEHPNVVPVHYVELDADGTPLVVLKRIEGVEWSKIIHESDEIERRFGATDHVAWNLNILMQVLNAIRFAHHRGVIHRDLKPSNVMIGNFGEVYLLDWGIAVSLRDDGSGRLPLASKATELAGTPAYMAPEMLAREGAPPQSERTDVYLAGSVLFELITGHPPHLGSSLIAVIASIVAGAPELPADVPEELAAICKRAMDDIPAQRFASVEEMRLAIQAYLEHRGSLEMVVRARARVDELVAALAANAERDDIYRVFGACRFGFIEALSRWPDNGPAKDGLARASIAMAEYELANDKPAAALSLLADIDAPGVKDVKAKAEAAAFARSKRLADLEKLQADYDPTIGQRTRSGIMMILGAVFTTLPIGMGVVGWKLTHPQLLGFSLGFLAVAVGCGVWARQTMMATLFNKRLFAVFVFVFVAQTVLVAGGWASDTSPMVVAAAGIFLWGVITSMMAIAIDAWLAPAAAAYFIAFLVASTKVETTPVAAGLGNFVFTINAVLRWRPERMWMTDEERIAVGRKPRRKRAA